MKISILWDVLDKPIGGGNQFLRALRNQLIKKGLYVHNPKEADCLIFNSYHNVDLVLQLKLEFQNRKIFIHRIDHPLFYIKRKKRKINPNIYKLNKIIADGTIFQSKWCKRDNYTFGYKKNSFETIIMNAVDPDIFFSKDTLNERNRTKQKYELVAVSWSENFIKGFDLYRFLDENLDFNLYSMTFIGKSPITFKNIKHINPVKSKELAILLREKDIYITGAMKEHCSNSLIEALSCGLPSVALESGSLPEILKKGGETFKTYEECLEKIQLVKSNILKYRENISLSEIEKIANKYIKFIEKIYQLQLSKKYKGKILRKFEYYKIIYKFGIYQIKNSQSLFLEFFRRIIFLKEFIRIIRKKKRDNKDYKKKRKFIKKNKRIILFNN
ncbi:MAG: glycosyltransferase [Promethearchaeota archaeon]